MREQSSMMPQAWAGVPGSRARIAEYDEQHGDKSIVYGLLKKEMQFEREFVAAGRSRLHP